MKPPPYTDFVTAVQAHQIQLRWNGWRAYQAWQAAVEMNLLFGELYIPVPPVPEEYREEAQRWYSNRTH